MREQKTKFITGGKWVEVCNKDQNLISWFGSYVKLNVSGIHAGGEAPRIQSRYIHTICPVAG